MDSSIAHNILSYLIWLIPFENTMYFINNNWILVQAMAKTIINSKTLNSILLSFLIGFTILLQFLKHFFQFLVTCVPIIVITCNNSFYVTKEIIKTIFRFVKRVNYRLSLEKTEIEYTRKSDIFFLNYVITRSWFLYDAFI